MSKSFLYSGDTPTLDEVLHNREMRVNFIHKLLTLHPDSTIISFKLNIPGPVKNNETIEKIFNAGVNSIDSCIKGENWNIAYSKRLSLKTGSEYFVALTSKPTEIKKKMTFIEENEMLGRLFDIDVLYIENDKVESINREKIGFAGRKCFVCSNDAKICSSRRTHTLSEMFQSIEEIIKLSNII